MLKSKIYNSPICFHKLIFMLLIACSSFYAKAQKHWYRVDKPGGKTCFFIDTLGNKAGIGEHAKLEISEAFSEGLICVNFKKPEQEKSAWGCLNENGDTVIRGLYLEPFTFSNGAAKVAFAVNSANTEDEEAFYCHYINKQGLVIRDTVFECSLSTGMVNKWALGRYGIYWYILSNRGVLRELSVDYETVYPFSDGLARCKRINGYYSFIDTTRWPVLETNNENYCGDFVNGYAPYSTVKGKFGFMNRKGVPICPSVYDAVFEFHEHIAAVKLYEKWGALDSKGKLIIYPVFEEAFAFKEGLAAVSINKKTGYINYSGELVIAAVYSQGTSFCNGIAAVANEKGLWGYINKKGEWVIKPMFLSAPNFDEQGFAVVEYTDKKSYSKGVLKRYEKALISKNGKVVWQSGEVLVLK